MYLVGKITVTAVLPEQLNRLSDIAYNLWWSWNSDAIDLYREIDLALWEKLGKNPIWFLQEVSQKKLDQKIEDREYLERYRKVVEDFDRYMTNTNTWFSRNHPDKNSDMGAYFSAEYGLNEVLPIYSGGLGVLSGDHCKAASDLGIPFTPIGLFYKQGYFSQHINKEGWQETMFGDLATSHLPVKPVKDKDGNDVYINVELAGRTVYARVWSVAVGRIKLYLMDTDVEMNSNEERLLTSRLYGGDQETRIQQEIILGIGGIRLLDTLGIKATVYHMNEGHSSFLGLELIKKLMQGNNLSFKEAKQVIESNTVFTTHTPVPAGNDTFPLQMIDKYFSQYIASLGIDRNEFFDLGIKAGDNHNFNMTVLALKLSGRKNGVSELHGAVSRHIFKEVWPGLPEEDVPITHVTNGIHTLTWMSPSIKNIFDRYLDFDWAERLYEKEVWDRVDEIPDGELWKTHNVLKTKMIGFIRNKLKEQRIKNGDPMEKVREVDTLFDSNALTIGFARRFATYKRANLIFRNVARILRILNKPDMPVQIIFAGKAHPADRPAHEIIKSINDIARQEGFVGKVMLVENYNMTIARNMVQGVDVWLNNPRRPLEASGTSGQKVCINGAINFSVLDGWWCEGYNGKNGWTIGDDTFYESEYYQDNADSESIYETLENQIVPLFYQRNEEGVPVGWVKVMKESIKSLLPVYNTHRMVQEYVNEMYVPAMNSIAQSVKDDFKYARELILWKDKIRTKWDQIRIAPEKLAAQMNEKRSKAGEQINMSTLVCLGEIDPGDVSVELYYGILDKDKNIANAMTVEMKPESRCNSDDGTCRYSASVSLTEGGEYGYTFRVLPRNPGLINRFNMGLIKWVE